VHEKSYGRKKKLSEMRKQENELRRKIRDQEEKIADQRREIARLTPGIGLRTEKVCDFHQPYKDSGLA
jgi:hypothetical protein